MPPSTQVSRTRFISLTATRSRVKIVVCFRSFVGIEDRRLATLRPALRPPSDVPLDCAGRRPPGWRDPPVHTELHYQRRDRRLCFDLAANRGGMVCATDVVANGKGAIKQQ